MKTKQAILDEIVRMDERIDELDAHVSSEEFKAQSIVTKMRAKKVLAKMREYRFMLNEHSADYKVE